jgi:hypothetical protein
MGGGGGVTRCHYHPLLKLSEFPRFGKVQHV